MTDRSVASGTLIEVSLELPESQGNVALTCRVVTPTQTDSGRYLVGSRILDMSADDQQRLNHYVRNLNGAASQAS